MSGCCSQGELRSYLDRELPRDGMAAVDAHLTECGPCRAAFDDIRGRAERVSALLGELERGGPSVLPMRRPARRWAAASAIAALAASLAVGYFAMPGRTMRRPGRAAAPVFGRAPSSGAATVRERTAPAAVSPPATGDMPSRRAPRVRRLPPARRPAPAPAPQYFVALDDEPLDGSAVLMRVALGPAGIPADVVFSPNGRPRAIRLANYQEGDGQ
jgi:hypothetical protein